MSKPDNERVVNYRPITIAELKPGDTIYISKNNDGVSCNYFCEFVKFEKGLVLGRQIWINPPCLDHLSYKGREIRARLDKCYLWGVPEDADEDAINHPYCCWFRTKNLKAGQ